MPRVLLSLATDDGRPNPFNHHTTRSTRTKLREFGEFIKAIAGGGVANRQEYRPTGSAGLQRAVGVITMNAANAADTVSIGGQNFTAAAGSPAAEEWDQSGAATAEATSLAAAINASAQTLVSGHVKASNLSGTVTAASVAVGDYVSLDGVVLTAIANGATANEREFSVGGNNGACATNLGAAINAHPRLRERFRAVVASDVVTVYQYESTTARLLSTSNGTRLAKVAIAAATKVLVWARDPGVHGNQITLVESTSGVRIAVSGARLTGGTSTTFTL
jgi:hypothetical protein